MRKIVANFFISLDGVVERPDQWHFPYFNDEMGEVVGAGMAASHTMLLGRRTYEEFAAFWPSQTEPPADHMNGIQKSRDASAGPRQALDEPQPDDIAGGDHHD